MWASVAGSWGEHADYVDARGAAAAEKMLELTAPQPGERVLELACGPGGLGLAAAELVAPDGEVVLSDVAAEMTSIASARAERARAEQRDHPRAGPRADRAARRLLRRRSLPRGTHVRARSARAVGEIRRVLRPGGRVALAVWGPRERNPWLGVVLDAVSAQIGAPVPPPGIPGPFSLADADKLTGLLSGAGLADVAVSELPVPLRAGSFEEWWERTTALAGPLARMLASMPEDARRALRTRAREAVGPYESPTGLEFPGVTLLASGRRT